VINQLGTGSSGLRTTNRSQSQPLHAFEQRKIALKYNPLLVSSGLLHNHPSGDPTPSGADVEMTRLIVEAGAPLKVAVHDHLVVGRQGVASFKALGLM
jgi:DNA repair protein RadC